MNDPHIRHIYRWDLDKTYLKTEFDTVRQLIKTALQKAEEKTNVPGAVSLLRELTRESDAGRALVTFVSGSPTQMRDVLMRKFELDGITPDQLILKPTLENILKGRFRAVRGQVGYKLEALLRVRHRDPVAPETMFGDDAEQDAFIYSLYSDLVADRIDTEALREILVEAEVYASPMERILELSNTVRRSDDVHRIFINLDRRSAPGRFLQFGPRVVPIVNYFQAAIVLWSDGVLPIAGLLRVADGMIRRDGYGLIELSNSFQDILRRRIVGTAEVGRFAEEVELEAADILSTQFAEKFVTRVRALAPRAASDTDPLPTSTPVPDYIEILRADRALKDALTERRTGLF